MILLRISFLNESCPELIVRVGVHEDESARVSRQTVVNDDVFPHPEAPETEVKSATVAIAETLVGGYHVVQ